MTLFSDKNNYTTIVSPDGTDIISSRMHYLHPEYVDEKSKFLYSQSRCPLSMLAETCKNVGKPVIDSTISQTQEPSVSISPSCSSSCSAPKFSPHSIEYSPVEQQSKLMDGGKEKSAKDKPKKRKCQKKEPEIVNKRPMLDAQALHSNYAISEFLKMNNISRDAFSKPEVNNFGVPMYNPLINQNIANQFNHSSSSLWKSKASQNARMTFPLNYMSHNYPPANIPMPNGLYRCPPPNILHDINQFYAQCPIDKPICDCLACNSRKTAIDKNLLKIEPLLANFLQNLYKERPINSSNMAALAFLQNPNLSSAAGGSAIKYCMYCGQCIPLIQNLLNHIHTEHVDCVNTNLCPKLDSAGNFSSNFNVESLQSKEMNMNNNLHTLKNMELLKQLQFMYNHNHNHHTNNNNNNNNNNVDDQVDNCAEKAVLMK